VRIANDSPYGLSGGVWSADRERAPNVARRIHTGTFTVNGAQMGYEATKSAATKSAPGARAFGPVVEGVGPRPSLSGPVLLLDVLAQPSQGLPAG
jgi:acyl-CoA reductase-like NAD-dependent aldehyde dehydrogenase